LSLVPYHKKSFYDFNDEPITLCLHCGTSSVKRKELLFFFYELSWQGYFLSSRHFSKFYSLSYLNGVWKFPFLVIESSLSNFFFSHSKIEKFLNEKKMYPCFVLLSQYLSSYNDLLVFVRYNVSILYSLYRPLNYFLYSLYRPLNYFLYSLYRPLNYFLNRTKTYIFIIIRVICQHIASC
jgi:hypothetical protein